MSLDMWNKSIQLRIEVEIKLALIDITQRLNAFLPDLKAKFAKLEKDLETLRHQFKGKNRPIEEQPLAGNRAHLCAKFEELKTTFYAWLLIWINVQPKCAANLKELEATASSLSHIAAHALEPQADLKRLLDSDIPNWVKPFHTAPAAIQAHLEEISLWMDITSAMTSNPKWTSFPTRQAFINNLMCQYTAYTAYREEIKRIKK